MKRINYCKKKFKSCFYILIFIFEGIKGTLAQDQGMRNFKSITCISQYIYETKDYNNPLLKNFQVLKFNNWDKYFNNMTVKGKKIEIKINQQNNVVISNIPEMIKDSIINVTHAKDTIVQSIFLNSQTYSSENSFFELDCFLDENINRKIQRMVEKYQDIINIMNEKKMDSILQSDFDIIYYN